MKGYLIFLQSDDTSSGDFSDDNNFRGSTNHGGKVISLLSSNFSVIIMLQTADDDSDFEFGESYGDSADSPNKEQTNSKVHIA